MHCYENSLHSRCHHDKCQLFAGKKNKSDISYLKTARPSTFWSTQGLSWQPFSAVG